MDKLRKTIIYRLHGINYIGSTIQKLKDRKWRHNTDLHNENSKCYNTKLYKHMRKNKLNVKLIIIKILFVGSYGRKRAEQDYINLYDSINNGYNTIRAYRTEREKKENDRLYRLNYKRNKIKIREYTRLYYKKNKEIIRQKEKKRINCSICNKNICAKHVKRHQRSDYCKSFQ